MRKPGRLVFIALSLVFMLVATGCGGSSGGNATSTETSTTSVSGSAFKGPIIGGTVTVYALNTDGLRGAALATTTTDANGAFSFSQSFTGPIEVVVTGGSYVDEATGQSVDMSGKEMSMVKADGAASGASMAVTPLTNAAATQAKQRAANGESLSSTIATSNSNVAEAFGLSGVDITSVKPADLTKPGAVAGSDETNYAAAIAALSQQAKDNGQSPESVLATSTGIGGDLVDGAVNDGTFPQVITGLNQAAQDFLNGSQNQSGVTGNGVNLTPTTTPSTTPTPTPTPTASPVAGCNHPDATNYDPTVTVYLPGSCQWPTATPVNGACGTANGKTYLETDTSYGADTFCAAGIVTPVSPAYPGYTATTNWSCQGVNGGTTSSCSASRNADTTPPTTTAGPTEGAKTSTSRILSATINEAGTGYCVAVTNGSAAPTSAEVVANSNANAVGTGGTVAMTANTPANCTVTIPVNITYDFYFVAKDTAGNLQTAPAGPATIVKYNVVCGANMVKFTGGTFTMGDNTDGYTDNLEHTVTLSDFCIDAKEVTQAEHQAWHAGVNDTTWVAYGFDADANCGGSRATCPAEQVDWTNAQAYCVAQGKRLPTEAEWEYAARNGGQAVVYATGNPAHDGAGPVACTDANYNSCNGGGATSAVDSYGAQTNGLFNMAGNVVEWTGDWYDAAYYANGQVNPTGPTTGSLRVARGGSWFHIFADLRASLRDNINPALRVSSIGFRCSSN